MQALFDRKQQAAPPSPAAAIAAPVQRPGTPANLAPRPMVRRVVMSTTALAAILVIVGLGVTWRMSQQASWHGLVWDLLPLVALLGISSYMLRFLRWHVLARRVAPRLPLLASLRIYMAGFAMGMTPGRVGELLKFSLLRDATGVDQLESTTIYPVERATEAASFVLLAVAGAALGHLHLEHLGIGALATIAVLPILVLLPVGWRLMRGRGHRRTGSSLAAVVDRVVRGLMSVAGPRALLSALCCAVTARCCDAAMFWLAAHVAGLNLSVAGAAFAWGLAGLVGGLSLMPAGVGAVEASLVATVTGLGYDGAMALIAVLLCRIMTLWLWVPPGLWLAFWSSRSGAVPAAGPGAPPRPTVMKARAPA